MKQRQWLRSSNRGFTLIEVLTVIVVISILAAAIYSGFDDARDDSKDRAVRLSIKETQLAIELFKAQNGRYPIEDDFEELADPYPLSQTKCGAGNVGGRETWESDSNCLLGFIPALAPEFTDEEPSRDLSANSNCVFTYSVEPDGSAYELTAENCLAGSTETLSVSSLGG